MVRTRMHELTQPTASVKTLFPLVRKLPRAASAQESAHALAQRGRVDWLRLVGVGALREGVGRVAGAEAGGDEDGRGRDLGRRAHTTHELYAVGRRHRDVGHD